MPDTAKPAHVAEFVHDYVVRFPARNFDRAHDPHYPAFLAFKKRYKGTDRWVCHLGAEWGDFSDCSLEKPLEVHHAILEWALQFDVDPAQVHKDFAQVTDVESLAAFVESDANFLVLCKHHHTGFAGIHTLSAADWAAYRYVGPKMIVRGKPFGKGAEAPSGE